MTFPTQNGGAGGGTDFQKKTPAYFAGSLNTTTIATLLSVNGRGILSSISVFNAANANIRIRITIDGVVVADDNTMFTGAASLNAVQAMTYMWGFKRSLLIESSQSTASNTNYKVNYMLG